MVSGYAMAGNQIDEISCDIIICGAGLAGLSLAYRALKSGLWTNQNIIIIDSTVKKENDKTWSFWKKEAIAFEELAFKTWDRLSVFSQAGEKISLKTGGYTYNSIRSIDFYNHVLAYLSGLRNVQFIYDEVQDVHTSGNTCLVETKYGRYNSTYVFNSIYEKAVLNTNTQYFLQHFKGLLIKSSQLSLIPNEAYLMDFRTGQEHGSTFFYTLPISVDEVFIEYTIFSKALLSQKVYDVKLSAYIKDVLKVRDFKVVSEEYGVIPMTDHRFTRFHGNIVNIGTIGGDTRGATGYTFTNVQKTINKILEAWSVNKTPFFKGEHISKKHHLYDATLLNVLDDGKYPGHQLFCDLFKNTDASYVFAFLDAETNLFQDLKIITSLKPMPFIKAMITVL